MLVAKNIFTFFKKYVDSTWRNSLNIKSITLNNIDNKNTHNQNFGQNNATSPSYNNSFDITFAGRKDYTDNEKDFAKFKMKLSKMFHKANVKESQTCWDFYINSTAENQAKNEAAFHNLMEISSDKNIFQKLLDFEKNGVKEKSLKRPLDDLIKSYKESVKYVDDINKMQEVENEIGQKFNSCRGEINGKSMSNAQISKLLETERNPEIRQKLYYESEVKAGDLIADDLVRLVKQRNKFAKNLGYSDYFSYKLKESYQVDEKDLFNLLDDLDDVTLDISKKITEKNNHKLANAFGIKPDEVQTYHMGLMLDDNPWLAADKYLKNNDQVVSTASNMFKRMGWDVSKLPITLDLFPKDNKNQHGFCFDIDTNKDVRILANLINDTDSLETLNHELGHAVYDLGISSRLPYFDRGPASSAFTEAIAMLMESLPYRESTLVKDLNMPTDLIEKLKVSKQKQLVNSVRDYLQNINFEKQLYANPNQDIKMLWNKMEMKYCHQNMPKHLDNTWASIPHFLTHPVYLQNYLRAEIMAAQIYEAASEKLGVLTENPKTAEFFRRKLFSCGASMKDSEIIEKFSGKKLGVEAFLKQLKNFKV